MGTARRLLAATIFAALPVLCAPAAFGADPAANPANAGSEVIVEWKPGTTSAQKAGALSPIRVGTRSDLNSATSSTGSVEVVSVAGTRSGAMVSLAGNPNVASVEPNRVLRHRHYVPDLHRGPFVLRSAFNDPLLVDGTQWQLLGNDTRPRNKYGSNAAAAWRRGIFGDPNVYVGIVDDGIDISHPDLAANVFTNWWDPPNGIDDDHNGLIDDTHGWDFYNNDNTLYDGKDHFDFIDAHGTIVAGEVAELQNNGIGGSGAAPGVKVIPAKFLGPEDGTTAGAIAALDYLTDLKQRHGLNIVASNNSWEGDDTESHALQAAIQRGADAGILFVTISGNGDWDTGLGYNIDRRLNYPASLRCHLPTGGDCMVVTTAIDDHGRLPEWANWGRRTVDLGAPGVGVWSTFPQNDYQAYDGTSQAAPLVSAAIALYRTRYPWASATRTRHALLQSTTDTPSLNGKTRTGGRLDIQQMLANDHDDWNGDDGWSHDGRE